LESHFLFLKGVEVYVQVDVVELLLANYDDAKKGREQKLAAAGPMFAVVSALRFRAGGRNAG
jgi:hypothetical protein